jgi:hypothetical protein
VTRRAAARHQLQRQTHRPRLGARAVERGELAEELARAERVVGRERRAVEAPHRRRIERDRAALHVFAALVQVVLEHVQDARLGVERLRGGRAGG